jgi:hypothetical protein
MNVRDAAEVTDGEAPYLSYFWIVRSSTPPCRLTKSYHPTWLNPPEDSSCKGNVCPDSHCHSVPVECLTVRYRICPPVVDFPASTCPMNTMLRCSLRSTLTLKLCRMLPHDSEAAHDVSHCPAVAFIVTLGDLCATLKQQAGFDMQAKGSQDCRVVQASVHLSSAFCSSSCIRCSSLLRASWSSSSSSDS